MPLFIGGEYEKDFSNNYFCMLISGCWIFRIGPCHVCRWLHARKANHSRYSHFDFRFTYIYFHQTIEKHIQLIHNKPKELKALKFHIEEG